MNILAAAALLLAAVGAELLKDVTKPSSLDSRVNLWDAPHLCYRNTSVPSSNEIVLFLPRAHAIPQAYVQMLISYANVGAVACALSWAGDVDVEAGCYPNEVFTLPTSATCLHDTYISLLTGNVTEESVVPAIFTVGDSIAERKARLLAHLATVSGWEAVTTGVERWAGHGIGGSLGLFASEAVMQDGGVVRMPLVFASPTDPIDIFWLLNLDHVRNFTGVALSNHYQASQCPDVELSWLTLADQGPLHFPTFCVTATPNLRNGFLQFLLKLTTFFDLPAAAYADSLCMDYALSQQAADVFPRLLLDEANDDPCACADLLVMTTGAKWAIVVVILLIPVCCCMLCKRCCCKKKEKTRPIRSNALYRPGGGPQHSHIRNRANHYQRLSV